MLFHYRLRRFYFSIDGVDLLKPTLSFACFFLLPVVKEHHRLSYATVSLPFSAPPERVLRGGNFKLTEVGVNNPNG
jgi:hypothetical protein